MGTFTAPKNGRARQSLSTPKSRVLKTGAGMMGSIPTAGQDAVTQSKGKAWDLSKNKMACC